VSQATTYLPPRQPHQPVQRLAKWALITISTMVIVGALYLLFRGIKPRQVTFGTSTPAAHVSPIADGWVQGLPDQPVAVEPPPKPSPPVDEQARRDLLRLQKQQEERDEQMKKQLAEIRELINKQKPPPATKEPPKRERAKAVYVVNEQKAPALPRAPLYTLAVWEYIPCVLENVVNSEIPGSFTVKITRPVLDATRQHVLIPQGQRVGAKAETADLLFGNERIPTFALSVSLPNGQPLELGHAPIMDAAGTNGLTGEVNNHIWRLIWTSVFIGGLQGGQQVLQQEIAGNNGAGAIAAGIARQGNSATQQRLGRAQDTRPTIIAHAGELCNILVPEARQLPSFAPVPH